MKAKAINSLIRLIGVVSLFAAGPAWAGEAGLDQATRPLDVPIREQVERVPEVSPKKKPAKAPEPEKKAEEDKGPKFFVEKIVLEGCESIDIEDLKPLIEQYENKETTLSELNRLAKALERLYVQKGVIASVSLPPQEIDDKTVTIRVLESRMGALHINDLRYFSKDRIAYYWHPEPGEILFYDDIARSLQLMNKNPDREVKASLHKGDEPGTTDVTLSADTAFPLHFTASWDNEGSPYTGEFKKGTGLVHNNFLGLDDTLIVGRMFTQHGDYTGVYAYHSVPVTNFGTSIFYGHSYGKAFPAKEYEMAGIDSRSRDSSFFIHQDIFSGKDYVGEVYVGLDAKNKVTKQNGAVTNQDRLRIARLGGTYTHKGFGSVTYISPEASIGLDAFGSRPRNDLSSRDASSKFYKLGMSLQHKRMLPLSMQGSLRLKGQVSSSKLAPQEQFYLGGANSVRGYASGDYAADHAIQANAELLIPAFFIPDSLKLPHASKTVKEDTAMVVFADYGFGNKKGHDSAEDPRQGRLASVGAGIRTKIYDQAVVKLEWGFPIGDDPFTQRGHSRFHASISFQDDLPKTIERIEESIEENNIKLWARELINRELRNQGSALREKLYFSFFAAKRARQKGRLTKAKEYYEQSLALVDSVYQQAEIYVRKCVQQKKTIQAQNEMALEYYNSGRMQKAKEIWQETVQEGQLEPLVLKF
ncbi:MAG: ShlB/FhaC/HecB family hemolysin secretion/activation protein [Candidatus Omnitrophota bacterium]